MNEAQTVENGKVKKQKKWRVFGEFRWEKYFCWIGGIVFLVFAVSKHVTFINWIDSLQIAMLAFILGYLSEMRYRFFKDVRND
ncbi:MAG: hypothetical protein E4H13_06410 [Calditrichales bacterium]|nr:MAG: hypothetical protein E4H13_06410 [Calditrichales bacterium]